MHLCIIRLEGSFPCEVATYVMAASFYLTLPFCHWGIYFWNQPIIDLATYSNYWWLQLLRYFSKISFYKRQVRDTFDTHKHFRISVLIWFQVLIMVIARNDLNRARLLGAFARSHSYLWWLLLWFSLGKKYLLLVFEHNFYCITFGTVIPTLDMN